jgi:hypothetical protein
LRNQTDGILLDFKKGRGRKNGGRKEGGGGEGEKRLFLIIVSVLGHSKRVEGLI